MTGSLQYHPWGMARSTALLASLALAGPVLAGAPEGVWRSKGYGIVAEVKNGVTTLYDVTSATCLQRSEPVDTVDALFQSAHTSADGNLLVTTSAWALTTLYFDRIARVPRMCENKTPPRRDPLYNFDVFWNTFNDYYAFFAERGVDWNAIRDDYRPRINSATTDAELFDIFKTIYRQLQDRHVALMGAGSRASAGSPAIMREWYAQYAASQTNTTMSPAQFILAKSIEYLQPAWQRYLDANSLRHLSNNVTTASAAGGSIGYLMITSETGYSTSENRQDSIEAAFKELDGAFAALSGKRGLILDMRFNTGGDDEVALAIAGLLTPQDRPGFSKCTRDGAGYTPLQRTTITHRKNAFVAPVVILTSTLSVSAGENVVMMAKDFPNVLVVGERTASVHSDALAKSLPNGWRFTLSNEVFIAPDGSMYESVGVPPDLLVPYEPEAVKSTGIDPQIEKALHLLTSDRYASLAAAAKRRGALGRASVCR